MEKIIINSLSAIGISTCAYLGIDHQVIVLYGILIFIDFITGVIKGWLHKDLKSKTAIYGFVSKSILILLVFSVAIVGKIAGYNMQTLMSGLIGALALAELYSIVSNIYEIRTGKKATEYDALSIIITGILGKIKNLIEKFGDGKKN